ncbi:MAG: DUF3450 domain-containing protein [Deltaproteobacteria bacterium]|nr:DUF3450 domain-containing protein [Deltaproteobacteria bacterium]
MHDTWKSARTLVFAVSSAAALLGPGSIASAQDQGKLDAVLNEQAAADKSAAESQKRIDELFDEEQDALSKYRQAKADTDSINAYSTQLEAQIKAQQAEIEVINKQLGEIETTARDVLPLMRQMVETLDQFVQLDLPFLPEERAKRVATLTELLDRADVTTSEKYRRILEAYQIEMEYGRTLEAYDGKISDENGERTVNFLRVGRVALMYQTLDGGETGYWDAAQKKWVVDPEYEHAIKDGLRVAKKLGAPDLLVVPIPAPQAKDKEAAS